MPAMDIDLLVDLAITVWFGEANVTVRIVISNFCLLQKKTMPRFDQPFTQGVG